MSAAPASPDVVCLGVKAPGKARAKWSPVSPERRAAGAAEASEDTHPPRAKAAKAAKAAKPQKAAKKAVEKRAARLVGRPSAKILQRIDRAKEQRLYLVR